MKWLLVLCAAVAVTCAEESKKDKRGLLGLGLGLGLGHSGHHLSLGHEYHAAPIAVAHSAPISYAHHAPIAVAHAEPIHLSAPLHHHHDYHHHAEPIAFHHHGFEHSAHLGLDHLAPYPYAHDFHHHGAIIGKTISVAPIAFKKTIAAPIIAKSYIAEEPLHYGHHELLHGYHH